MSTIVTDTLQGKTSATTITIGSTPVVSASANSMTIRGEGSAQTSIQQGLAKLWVNIDGTGTIGNSDSYNVTSLTDNTTGDYTITINANMNNATYAVASHTGGAGQNVVTNRGQSDSGYTYQTTSTNRFGNRNTSDQNWNDNDIVTGVFFGDLA